MYIAECRAMGIRVADARHQPLGHRLRRARPVEVPDGVTLPLGSPGRSRSGCRRCATSARGSSTCCSTSATRTARSRSFHDFAERVPEQVLNKRAVESLIKAGAFDSLGHTRKGLLAVFEHIIDTTLTRRRERDQGVMSLFGDWSGGGDDGPAAASTSGSPIPDVEFDKTDKLRHEKEMLGLYVSDHPLFGVEAALRRKVEQSIAELAELDDGATVTSAASITGLTRKFTKKGDQMAVFVLEDLEATSRSRCSRGRCSRARPQARRRPRRRRQGPPRPPRRGPRRT